MEIKLADGEFAFMKIVWENSPLFSKDLVCLCQQKLGWKKSTTYTVLKRLIEKELVENNNSQITALINRQEVQKYETEHFLNRSFSGSLPSFLATFMEGKKLSCQEAEELKKLIDQYKERE